MRSKIIIFALSLLLSALAFADSGKAVYEQVCATCHASGVMDAPKLYDKEAWGPRLAQGRDKLISHSDYGYKAMPAHGGNDSLSDKDVEMAVDYMIIQVGGYSKKSSQ